jgi:hypothetical protein
MHDNILIASIFPTINLIFLLETTTLVKFITMLCGNDNIPWNIPHIEIEYGEYQNIPWNIVNPT